MEEIVSKQREYFNTNATKDINFRIAQLQKLHHLLKDNEELLLAAIYADFKKSPFDALTNELALIHHDIREAVNHIRQWARPKRVKTNILNFPAKSYVIPEPLGVSLIISPWNYPYQLALSPAVASIAAGNTVIVKPSELTQHTSRAIADLINNHFAPEYFKVIEGAVRETAELLDQKFDHIFFTGSVPVGKIIYQAAAKNLTPVTLELGGKSPAFVVEDCNLEVAVKRMVWAKFINAGQTCLSPDYVMVHKSIEQKFLQLAVREIERVKFAFDNDNYVQIINQRNMQRLIGMIQKDHIYFGGNYDIEQRYFEPTILTGVSFEDHVMQDEIFGPIWPVLTYERLDEAIAKVKQRPKPLSCYVFTSSKTIRDKVLHELSFGGGMVNDAVMHISNSNMGFGGVGDSGIGRYHGEFGFMAFSHHKGIVDKPTWFDPRLRYHPHSKKALNFFKFLIEKT